MKRFHQELPLMYKRRNELIKNERPVLGDFARETFMIVAGRTAGFVMKSIMADQSKPAFSVVQKDVHQNVLPNFLIFQNF